MFQLNWKYLPPHRVHQVALKPHVDFLSDHAHWRGEIGPGFGPADWDAWFSSYTAYMLVMARLCVDEHVPLLVVGTELVTTVPQEAHWRALIAALRNATAAASPPVAFVYGANWSPGPAKVPWWDAVDLIGVDAYYPVAAHPRLVRWRSRARCLANGGRAAAARAHRRRTSTPGGRARGEDVT